MTVTETKKLLAIILGAYPLFQRDRDPEATVRLWHMIFENVPYQTVEKALLCYISTDTKGFPPMPGALNQIIDSAMQLEEMTESEAWDKVYKAIARSSYYAREAFASLPPDIQGVVRSPDQLHSWSMMDESYVQNNIRPFFCRAYRDSMDRIRRQKLLPPARNGGTNLFVPSGT